jgi:hypothetical protein
MMIIPIYRLSGNEHSFAFPSFLFALVRVEFLNESNKTVYPFELIAIADQHNLIASVLDVV